METEKEDMTKSSLWIPFDVIIHILLRLPAKSVVKFRCVSKLWSSITTTPQFINSFTVHSLARPSLLLVHKKEDKRVFCSLPHRQDPQRRYTRVEKYQMMVPKQDPKLVHGKVFSSIRGLICFEDLNQVVIWNPSLRQHIVLPDPKLSRPLVTFLGYDPIDDQYKVLCMSGSHSPWRENPRILTLKAQESWRITEPSSPGLSRRCHTGVVKGGICLNGILYYYKNDYDILESFDVRSEKFKRIRKPNDVFDPKGWGPVITSNKGRLAWLSDSGRRWILTDPDIQEWSQGWYSLPNPSILPRMDGPYDNSYLQFGGVTDNEEIICMQQSRTRLFYAFYRDMKKNTTRWVAYEGLADYDSHYCDRFPNHIENLMSLANLVFS